MGLDGEGAHGGDAGLAGRRVDAARMLREAVVAHARAHVEAARAAGWPSADVVHARDGEATR